VTNPSDDADNVYGPRLPTTMTIIGPGDHGPQIGTDNLSSGSFARRFNRRRFSKASTLFALAALCGAVGGVAAATAVGHFLSAPAAPQFDAAAYKDTIARIDADVTTLRASFDKTGKARTAQFGKVSERLEKLEKSNEDTSTKLSKINENLEKTRATLNAQPTTIKPTSDITGSIPTPVAKPDTRKPPIVQDWVLNRVSRGGALVEGERGLFQVYPGDPLPGLGRVEAVRYQDGRWVVVTQRGLIVRP